MKYKLAIFDLDGTILNTLEDLANCCNAALNHFGMEGHSLDEIRLFVGNGIPKLIERAVPDGKNNPHYDEVLNYFIEYYEKHSMDKTGPYAGITELLKKMKDSGMKLSVNTNKLEEAAAALCSKYFPGVFDAVSGGKLDRPPKPAGNGVNEILEKIPGIKREEAVYIGDSDVDIQTGKNAGIDAIGAAWGFRGYDFLKEHGAEKIACSAEELWDFLK